MSFTGVWRNNYDSIMSLRDGGGGLVVGAYSSHTGSTGVYFVVGTVSPPAAEEIPGLGSSVSLSIFWRSVDGGPRDPSWHWVSGLGGQLLETPEGWRIDVAHALVATAIDFNDVPVGTYIDKLVFVPEPESSAPRADTGTLLDLASRAALERGRDRIGGDWHCSGPRRAELVLGAPDDDFGLVRGEFTHDGRRWRVFGFADVFAAPEGLDREALTLSASSEGGRTITLAGWCDLASEELELTVLENRSTSPSLSYTQSVVGRLAFTR